MKDSRRGTRPIGFWRWIAVVLLSGLGLAAAQENKPEFSIWLTGLREEARGREISDRILDAALAGVQPLPRVIELDRNQPEFKLSLNQYLDRVISDARVAQGRRKLAEHRDLLQRVASKYGVQPRFIVALWGIETNYGERTGGFRVIEALATLAYDGRRSEFFRGELMDALSILEDGHIAPERMIGSWAGAMGQPQFMPSSFRSYAVDFDGDSRRDIWDTTADVLASAANYLARSGWKGDQTWGRRVRLPQPFDPALVGREVVKGLNEWQRLGVRRADGRDLPRRDLPASVVQPGGADGPAYVVYDNYRTLLKWNRSDYFATSVGILSDRLARPGG